MIADSAAITFSSPTQIAKTLRPVAAVSIYGIVFDYGTDGTEPPRLLAVDSKNGYLLAINPLTQNTQILNAQHWQEFVGATGLAIADGQLWFTSGQSVYSCSLKRETFYLNDLPG